MQSGCGAGGGVRKTRNFRCVDRERVGPGTGGVHLRARARAGSRRHHALFRTATRQSCATSAASRPSCAGLGFKATYSSGWHLHQSLVGAKDRANLFMPAREGEYLSPLGLSFLGGILKHAVPATALDPPTVNGYRRFDRTRSHPTGLDGATITAAPCCACSVRRAIRRAGSRTVRASLQPIPICSSPRRSLLASKALTARRRSRPARRRALCCRPAAFAKEPFRGARRARTRAVVPQGIRRCVHRLFPQAQAQRGRPLSEMDRRRRCAGPDDGTTEWEQREYFDFF